MRQGPHPGRSSPAPSLGLLIVGAPRMWFEDLPKKELVRACGV